MTSPNKAQGVKHGIVALLVIVALGGAVLWFFTRPAPKVAAPKEPKKPVAIKAVTPAPAPTNAVPAKPEKKIEFKKLDNGMIMKYVNGKQAWMYPREDYHGPIHTTRVHYVQSLEDKTFKHTADRQIAGLLTITPGSNIVGGPDYRRSFVKDFLKSYDDPFVIEPSDTEEQKELKRAVAEVKGDLKARYDAGEDIAQIMIDTRDNFRQLAAYKRELQSEVTRLSKDENATAADVEDFVKAADKMLTDRGIKPMGIHGFIKHQIKVLKAREADRATSNAAGKQ